MINDTYSVSDIQCLVNNIDNGIKYFKRERKQASTRLHYEYLDGYIDGLKRAKYLLLYMKGKEWNLPAKTIYKEDTKQ